MPKGISIGHLAVYAAAAIVATMFLWIVGDILIHGLGQVNWRFLVDAPMDAGRAGGIGPILVSTALVLLVCLGAALPVAVLCAMYLIHRGGSRLVRASLDVLAGVPSIVFGLFGAVLFGKILGLGFSILSGGLTLACMVLPLLIRTTEAALSNLPTSYRLGAAALGLGPFAVLFKVLLPPALPGITVGLVLGIGRAMAETAALIFTAGYVDRMPGSLFDSGRVLSIHIYDLSMNVPGGDANAYGSAAVLLALLLMINAAAAWMTRRWQVVV
jgi:phosphate transport system permease protein